MNIARSWWIGFQRPFIYLVRSSMGLSTCYSPIPRLFFLTSTNKWPHMNGSSTKSVPLRGYEWIQLSIRGKGLYTYGLLELKRSCLEAMALTKCALPVTSYKFAYVCRVNKLTYLVLNLYTYLATNHWDSSLVHIIVHICTYLWIGDFLTGVPNQIHFLAYSRISLTSVSTHY